MTAPSDASDRPEAATAAGSEASTTSSDDRPEAATAADAPGRSHRGDPSPGTDFIRSIVQEDVAAGTYDEVVTRFPPEPNGYLHIGHAKSICLNFGIAREFDGRCHLRFDDTNPLTEEEEYAEAIKRDVRWLGWDWGEHLYHAADYFDKLYDYAELLVEKGKAYVDSQPLEEIREQRGTVTEPGVESPYRDRSPEENLDLLRRMKAGEFEEGAHVLRAKIDMASPNMLMRDPVLYRIIHASHYRSGDAWCIYPMYDFAHCLEDAIEGVTHSLCTLEFENNRELYDWILDEVGITEPRPHQYEFARLNLEYTVLSKRKLIRLVKEGHVDGWDDPRMPTIAGLRRRGIPPGAIREFCDMIGVAKADSTVDVGKLEYAVRDHLNWRAPRIQSVIDPLKLVVENWPEGETEWLDAPYYPRDVDREGSREIPFTRELWIERDDFATDPPKGFRRMAPGRWIRLRYGYIVKCEKAVTDPETGEVTEIHCTYDPETKGGSAPDDRKVWGTIHFVSAAHALDAEVRLYDRLFLTPDPTEVAEAEDFTRNLNPDSLVTVTGAKVEPSVADDDPDVRYQFERVGYFWRDPVDGRPGEAGDDAGAAVAAAPGPGEGDDDHLVFNRIVTLRDTWAKRARKLKRETGIADRARDGTAGMAGGGPATESGEGGSAGAGGAAGAGGDGVRGGAGAADAPDPEPLTPEERISDERAAAREADAELAARMDRYTDELGLSLEDADILTGSRGLSDFFEEALEAHPDADAVAAWISNELKRVLKDRSLDELPFGGRELGRLSKMVADDRINRLAAKEVLEEMVASGADPADVVEERGLEKVDDPEALTRVVEAVVGDWPDKVVEYREGRTGLLGFFIGKVMEETDGRADPKTVRSLLTERLS